MPICPGCERNVSYQELDVHERYCDGPSSTTTDSTDPPEQFEAKITYIEDEVDERLSELEKELQRELARARRFGDTSVEPLVRK
jgi:hypothetical protein